MRLNWARGLGKSGPRPLKLKTTMSNQTKEVTFSPSAREALIAGVNILSEAVKTTLGPKGRNVVIQSPYGRPYVTKDGVTVAKEINLPNPIQNLGANIVKQAAQRTAIVAGDGTTTATIIAQALINKGAALIEKGFSPITIKRHFEELAGLTVRALHSDYSKTVTDEDIRKIATISANNDEEIGSLINSAFEFVGKDGLIIVDDSKTGKSHVTTVDGTSLRSGYLSPAFVTNPEKMEAMYNEAYVLVTDRNLRSSAELLPVLNRVALTGKALVIIANDIDGQALNLLVVNRLRSQLPVIAIKAPAYADRRAEIIKDLAILTGATLISESTGMRLEDTQLEDLGQVQKVVCDHENTLLVGPAGNKEKINERIVSIQATLESAHDEWSTLKMEERIAGLKGKVAVLHVGAYTETEAEEIKARVDDALRATKASIKSGYVPGGGITLANIAASVKTSEKSLEPITQAFKDALFEPLKVIISNAGKDVAKVVDEIQRANMPEDSKNYVISEFTKGYNAYSDKVEDLIEAGVIDPTLVLEQEVLNATSAANMIILSEVTIHHVDQNFYNPGSLEDFNG